MICLVMPGVFFVPQCDEAKNILNQYTLIYTQDKTTYIL